MGRTGFKNQAVESSESRLSLIIQAYASSLW